MRIISNVTTFLVFGCIAFTLRDAVARESVGSGRQQLGGSSGLNTFEVATIKPARPGARGILGFISYPGGKVFVGKSTIRTLLGYVFNTPEFGIVGGPEWIDNDRYDITLLPPEHSPHQTEEQLTLKATPSDTQREMLESLLIERCNLKFHKEVREQPVYLLTRSGKALRLAKAKDSKEDPRGSIAVDTNGAVEGETFGTNMSMPLLASQLSRQLGRVVLDQTGLKGTYDYHLEPDDAANRDRESTVIDVVGRLGLRLRMGRGPAEIVVIDGILRPTPN